MSSGPGRPRHNDVLTPSEWKVAEQVRHGMTNRRIAERMGVSVDAVKFHVGNALDQFRRSAMHADSDSYMMLGQVARTTKRFDESRAWYRDTLGLPELYCF